MAADNSDHEELYLAAEENLETPGNLSWIHSQKGIDYFKEVLRGLSMAENETKEPDIAKSLLSLIEKKEKNSTEIVRNFLKEISNSFYKCYQLVQHVKCPNKKALVLERNFASLSSHSPSIEKEWGEILSSCGWEMSPNGCIVLNYILQHLWSCLLLNKSSGLPAESLSHNDSSTESSTSTTTELENIEIESIKEHGGWVIKRVRDMIQNGPSIQTIQVSKNSEASCEVSKKKLLDLIKTLGKDVLMQPGKFLFVINEDLLPLFYYLHESLEKIVKASLEEDANKDILKHGLEILSTDKTLRGLWCNITGNSEDQQIKASCVLVLQRIAVMFVKSKQQIIREQLQLKPKKQSSSLRQSLKKVSNKKKVSSSKSKDESDDIVVVLRKNMTIPARVTEFLNIVFANPETAPSILNALHGKELCIILRSLGLPGLNGKGKKRQINSLLTHHSQGKEWHILFPDKVLYAVGMYTSYKLFLPLVKSVHMSLADI